MKKRQFGELLVEKNFITQQQLQMALDEQAANGKRLGPTLIDLGFIDEETLVLAQAEFTNVPFVDLKQYEFKKDTVALLPEKIARRLKAIILSRELSGFRVAMIDSADIFTIDELQNQLQATILPAVAKESDIIQAIDAQYRSTEEMSSLATELENELGFSQDANLETQSDDASDAPVVRLLKSIFEDAMRMHASDIHIEPDEHVLRIRQRVDGVLHEQIMKEKRIVSALLMRLKIMSGLDISEKRLPQDGRFNMTIKNKTVDVRISTLPTQHGESVVMRILDQSTADLDLKKLGMPERILRRFEMLIQRPHGIILVTGPTGSGKTTTLYSALRYLNHPDKKIITAEDPVEYRLPRIQQVQVHPKIGLTFPSVLRAALRQDPDIVLIGEIRDKETTEIALKAAMTGHFVLSTLHTNDAISSAVRLLDMGAPGYLTATAVLAILAQRLVRRVCPYCREDYVPPIEEKIWIKTIVGNRITGIEKATFFKGAGCARCYKTGYSGRIGAYELLEMNDALADRLRNDDVTGFSQVARENPQFEPLVICALRYAIEGMTTLSEVFRLASSLEDVEKPKLPAGDDA
ncbi:MAG: GspE/PulE family protein [Pseudomonadota bacterium]